MAAKSTLFFAAFLLVAALGLSVVQEADADVLIGSCVRGAVDYKSNCAKYCKSRGYKNGHCGSFANVNCWCET